MAVLSRLQCQTIPSTCFEYVHPWQDSCVDATLGLMVDSFKDSLRIYTTVYLFTMLMKGKVPTKKTIRQTVLGILQSTIFLTTHAYGYSTMLCVLRRLLGRFDKYLVSFTPAFLSSLVAIHLERPTRRPLLCLYVTNVASETFFRMAVWRGWLKPIRHGEVIIFTVSSTLLLYLFRGEHSNDSIYSMLRFVIGQNEEGKAVKSAVDSDTEAKKESSSKKPPEHSKRTKSTIFFLIGNICRLYKLLVNLVKLQQRHSSCPHPHSCTYYVSEGLVKMFTIGYSIQTVLTLVLSLRHAIKKPSMLPKLFVTKKALNLGAFLGLYSGLFKGVSCALRWIRDEDSQYHAIPAGLLAGLSFWFYPDTTAALYVMWKTLQILYIKGVDNGYLPKIPGGTVLLYSFSTAVLFHAAILEPENLRPSYFRFLYNLSGGRIAAMSRIPIDEFGLGTSKALEATLKKLKLDPKPAYNFHYFGKLFPNY